MIIQKIKYIKELEGESGEWYQLNENEYSSEIVKHGEIVELNITNKPDNPDIDVEKDGIIQTTANQEIKYDFDLNIHNKFLLLYYILNKVYFIVKKNIIWLIIVDRATILTN